MGSKLANNVDINSLIETIRDIILSTREKIVRNINIELIATYWKIGKEIVEKEKQNSFDSESSRQLILRLSKDLTNELGKGFSRANLFNMRRFYLEYPDVQTVSGQLNWSHYCELLIIDDKGKRDFYEKEAINAQWSVRFQLFYRRFFNASTTQRINKKWNPELRTLETFKPVLPLNPEPLLPAPLAPSTMRKGERANRCQFIKERRA